MTEGALVFTGMLIELVIAWILGIVGDTVIVEYTVTGVHCEAEEAPIGEFALPD